jgi:hypothetical protein
MSDSEFEATRDLWTRVADDWRRQVGDDGDSNRILNSDPVLWQFVGDVSGQRAHSARRRLRHWVFVKKAA